MVVVDGTEERAVDDGELLVPPEPHAVRRHAERTSVTIRDLDICAPFLADPTVQVPTGSALEEPGAGSTLS